MSKFNLFTLFLTVIIVVIVGELLVNDYVDYPAIKKQITTNVLGSGEQAPAADADTNIEPQKINFNLDGIEAAPPVAAPPVTSAPDSQSPQAGLNDGPMPIISFSTLEEVGFQNVTLQRTPFNGILFEKIDLRDFKSVPVIQQNLLQHNRDKIAVFYELHAESKLLANEIYLLIKEKIGTAPGVGVNETNELGDGSFYVNYSDRPETAFLVVKRQESVYALSYRKELHTYIKSLLQLL